MEGLISRMKLKDVNKSIQLRMFLTLCVSSIVGIFIIVIINSLVLVSFYTYTKIKTAKEITKNINEYYESPIQYNINFIFLLFSSNSFNACSPSSASIV